MSNLVFECFNEHVVNVATCTVHCTTPVMPRMMTSRMSRRATIPVVMAATLQNVDLLA